MRARQIFDQRMREHGLKVTPRIETDSVEALLALASAGPWVAVVPESALHKGASTDLRALPLTAPEVFSPLALVIRDDEPNPPIAVAIEAAASSWTLP